MNATQRTQQKLANLQQEWKLLNEKLSRLEQARILETRADEIFRLEHAIEDVKKQIEHVEQELKNLEQVSMAPENELEYHIKKAIRAFKDDKKSIFVLYGNVSYFDEVKKRFCEYLDKRKDVLHLCIDAKLAKGETHVETIIELVLHIGDQFIYNIADSDEKNQLYRILYLIGRFSREHRGKDPEDVLAKFQNISEHSFYPDFVPIIRKNHPIVISFAQLEEILPWSNKIRFYLLQALLGRVTEGNLRFVIFAKHSTEPRLYTDSKNQDSNNKELILENITFYKLQGTETSLNVSSTTEITSEPQIVSDGFDVFLCHNSIDKPAIKDIARQLKERGIRPWLDIWELSPGLMWQVELDKQIENIKSAAVFVGQGGLGPWQDMEIYAFLSEFVTRKCCVIPVILPDCEKVPKLPTLLKRMMWVDFRQKESDPLNQLIWGITGEKPS